MIHALEASAFMAGAPPIILSGIRTDNTSIASGVTAASQTLISTPFLTISFWLKTSDASLWPTLIGLNHAAVQSKITLGGSFEGDISATIHGVGGSSTVSFSSTDLIAAATKTHVFISVDLNHATNAKIINMAINGATQSLVNNTDNSSGAYNLNWTDDFGVPEFSSGLGSSGAVIDFADVWIAVGQYVPLSDLTKFRAVDGSAVDLGADGSTATGTPPTYFFHGGSSTFGTNAGSGPTTSVVGSITDVTL